MERRPQFGERSHSGRELSLGNATNAHYGRNPADEAGAAAPWRGGNGGGEPTEGYSTPALTDRIYPPPLPAQWDTREITGN